MEHDVLNVAKKLFSRLDSARALTCFIMVKHGMWKDLVSLRVEPSSYEPIFHGGVSKYRSDVQATEFLRKCAGLPTGIDTASAARESFYACEAQNCDTNARLSRHLEFPVFETALEWQADILFGRARRWIAAVLGPIPNVLNGRFGPGATFESSQWRLRDGVTAYDKLEFTPAVTHEARFLVNHLVHETALASSWGPAALDREIPSVRGNRFATVPKDATKDRGICIEPGVNLIGQLSVGAAIRQRLSRVGIDLDFGQEKHRSLASSGSIDGSLSTIDLSNASDTVSRLLVRLLLPDEWYELVDSLRSHYTWIINPGESGRWVRLEKFSSMGNGFTFELETLIFAALCKACGGIVGWDTFVYGDDIVVPAEITKDVLALLHYSGFTPNERKTFSTGYFRESCGGDFLMGEDVRPIYLKEFPNEPTDWLSLANQLFRAATRLGKPGLMAVRNCAADRLPVDIRRCRGPQALGDLVLHDDDESKWDCRTRSSIRYIRVYRPVQRLKLLYATQRHRLPDGTFHVYCRPLRRYKHGVHFTAALMGLPSTGLAPRNAVQGYRFGRIAWS